jgi:hypothetical protein
MATNADEAKVLRQVLATALQTRVQEKDSRTRLSLIGSCQYAFRRFFSGDIDDRP